MLNSPSNVRLAGDTCLFCVYGIQFAGRTPLSLSVQITFWPIFLSDYYYNEVYLHIASIFVNFVMYLTKFNLTHLIVIC